MENNILTVTQLNYSVRNLLEMEFGHVWLIGEISNLSKPVSGHWYLTLKDEQAQVRCAMFRMKNMRVNFPVQNGMQVLVRATVSLYEPRGDYQVIIESMQPAGDGLLQQQFDALKLKLAADGLFAQEHKKALPAFVKRVGIVTSTTGAALQDMLNILKRRDPSLSIVIYPTMVQGKEATAEIVSMIELANLRRECDVLIIGRGGGSLEDLWCFNEEAVAYAIFRSEIPIISAVGHETDVTIADFVADLRAPTPSAAAELVSRDWLELARQLQQQLDKASFAFDRIWTNKQVAFKRLQERLVVQSPVRQLRLQQNRLALVSERAAREIQYRQQRAMRDMAQLHQRLLAQHPQKQLENQRGRMLSLFQQAEKLLTQNFSRKQQRWQSVQDKLARSRLPYQISEYQYQCETLEQRLHFAIQKQFTQYQQRFQSQCVKLEGLSPLKILARGYSVTQNQAGRALVSASEVKVGERIVSRLAGGELISEVVAMNTK